MQETNVCANEQHSNSVEAHTECISPEINDKCRDPER